MKTVFTGWYNLYSGRRFFIGLPKNFNTKKWYQVMKKKKKSSLRGKVWITFGWLFLAAAVGLTIYNFYESYRSGKASAEVYQKLVREIDEKDPDEKVEEEFLGDREMPTIEIDGYRYIGYLDVPDLKLHLPVMEEWDYDRLKIAPCRYSGTVYLDNMVIAGHNYRRHFSPLRSMPNGTKIIFTDVEGYVYHYEIAEVEILKPSQEEYLTTKTDSWDLTLFTCTIGGRTRHTMRCLRTDKEEY